VKVLIVGGGGREHALAWALSASPRVDAVFAAPGNGGTALVGENVDIGASDVERLVSFARDRGIDLTVVGPEAPLVAGIVDRFAEEGLACYGPRRAAARLEGSKVFAKEFMARN
jgi:phosphoribosylamine--glycine ligase